MSILVKFYAIWHYLKNEVAGTNDEEIVSKKDVCMQKLKGTIFLNQAPGFLKSLSFRQSMCVCVCVCVCVCPPRGHK